MIIEYIDSSVRMSRATIYNGTAYFCGQVPKDESADIKEQTATTLEKIEELLAKVGSSKSQILTSTIYLADMKYFQSMNEVWDAWVVPNFQPARTCVEAKMARPELLVEITITAALA